MATGTISLVAVLRDARESALLRTRFRKICGRQISRRFRRCGRGGVRSLRRGPMGNTSEPTGFVRRIFSENCKRSVLIEDNGRVGYAYLFDADGQICGDVWLYNRCSAPT